jgi:hypothetical protein
MKPEPPAMNESPDICGESENIPNQPAVKQTDAECESENPAPLPKTSPKPPGSFYETIYHWVMARS